MLLIGKADLYYTLWDVRSTKNYSTDLVGNHYLSSISTHFDYRQNLSMDESKAIEKAKGFGVTELEPNEELRGRYQSWKAVEKFDEPIVENVFTYGRNRGDLFIENIDVDYMWWYYDQDNFVSKDSKKTMKNRIVELDSETYVVYKGELMKRELMQVIKNKNKLHKKIKKQGWVEVFVDRNIDGYHSILHADGIWFKFDKVKENWYRDFSYYLPMINGKAKRIKNKTIKIFIERVATDGEPFDYVVDTFEVIKK